METREGNKGPSDVAVLSLLTVGVTDRLDLPQKGGQTWLPGEPRHRTGAYETEAVCSLHPAACPGELDRPEKAEGAEPRVRTCPQ